MEPVIYFNRTFLPEHDATVSVRSRALNYGLGCFAGIRGYKSDDGGQVNVFRLDRHVRRLEQSARILGLRVAAPPSDIADRDRRATATERDARRRLHSPDRLRNSNELSPLLDPDTSETAIFCLPSAGTCRPTHRRVRLQLAARARNGDSRARQGHRRLSEQRPRPAEARDNGYTEAILLTEDGYVSEGSAEHVFIVRDGQLISPPSTADNLDGITRQSLITLAREDLDIPFVERPIGRTELYVADEVFLCGTGAEVTPCDRSIDGPSRRPDRPSPVACPITSRQSSAAVCRAGPTG